MIKLSENLFSSVIALDSLDDLSEETARDTFDKYQVQGVIKDNCTFEDDVWQTTDEYHNIGLYFRFSVGTYNRCYKEVFNCELDEFVLKVKIYTLTLFGKKVLRSLQVLLEDLARLIRTPIDSVLGDSDNFSLQSGNSVTDFLTLWDENDKLNELVEGCEYYRDLSGSKDSNARTLADMMTYFLFGHIIENYWASPISNDDRMFYYPLYIWWKLTGVIPQRSCEFLLLSRDCLSQDIHGDWKLKIKRNRQKGSRSEVKGYTIDSAYVNDEIPVPDYIADLINDYILYSSDYEISELNTLFVLDTHYKKWGRKASFLNRYLSYINLNTILKSFYRDVIVGLYGYTIIDGKDCMPDDNEICYIHLGDTRHIALMNILAEGGNPVIATMLADHDSPNITMNYALNLEYLLECRVFLEHKKMLESAASNRALTKFFIPNRRNYVELQDGSFCFSEDFMNGGRDDCKKSMGPNGELMYCPRCPKHRNSTNYYDDEGIYNQNIESGVEELRHAVNAVRQERGRTEDIEMAAVRLTADCENYTSYYEEALKKMSTEDNDGEQD